jgi:hypothetical protein
MDNYLQVTEKFKELDKVLRIDLAMMECEDLRPVKRS